MLAQLSSKGQLVLPKAIREELHLKTGDQFQVRVVNGTITLEPIKTNIIQELCGKYAGHDFLKDLEEEHRWEVESGR